MTATEREEFSSMCSGSFAATAVSCAVALSAILYSDSSQSQSIDPAGAFEVLLHERVADLSGWRPTSLEQKKAKVSKVVWRDHLRVKRLNADAKSLVTRRAQSDPEALSPEVSSSTHPLVVHEIEGGIVTASRRFERAFDVRLDVSKEPVNKWFDVTVDTVYWNAFRSSSGAVVGIPVQFKTKSIRLEVSSPNRKFQTYDRMAFELSENSEKHVIDDAKSKMTSDHSRIVWSIDDVRPNWAYAIHWRW